MQPNPQLAEQESPANETIVAVSTPPGRGGIGIVRLSGPHALEIANALLTLRNPLAHAQARFAEIFDPETKSKLDGPMPSEYIFSIMLKNVTQVVSLVVVVVGDAVGAC